MRTPFAWTALILLCLAGCAGLPEAPEPPADWNARRARLDDLTHFTARGKIALRTPERAESASLLWQQVGIAAHIRLSGPMGLSATTIDSDGRQLEWRQGDESQIWALDDPALSGEAAWNLPLKALPHWLKGVPAPDFPVQALILDETGQLPVELQQQGWTIEYGSFDMFQSYRLPTRLKLYRADTSARIILRTWQDLTH